MGVSKSIREYSKGKEIKVRYSKGIFKVQRILKDS